MRDRSCSQRLDDDDENDESESCWIFFRFFFLFSVNFGGQLKHFTTLKTHHDAGTADQQ